MARKRKSLSLSTRLRATSLIPALVVSVVMSVTIYTVLEYNNRETLGSYAHKTIETMSVLYQGPLISGDSAVAETLMQSMMSDPDLISAKVFDVNGQLFAAGENGSTRRHGTLHFSENIYRETLSLNIWDEDDRPRALTLGHIELVVAPESASRRMNQVLFILYGVILLALVFSVWLGNTLSKSIRNPLKIIGQAVTQIRSGHYLSPPAVSSSDELGQLSDNILYLAGELSTKDEAIDEQMTELLRSREEAVRLQEENVELLKDLGNEYSDPIISAIGCLQKASRVVVDAGGSQLIDSALRNIEYLLNITGDFSDLIDQKSRSEALRCVPVQFETLTSSVVSACAAQHSDGEVSLVYSRDSEQRATSQTIYSDPIRIRVMLKNVLDYIVSHSAPCSRVTLRTVMTKKSDRTVIIVDIFDDNRYFSDEDLCVLTSYFSGSQDFREQDEYLSIPLEFRTANRVAQSLGGNLSVKRCINGGQILSIQFLANVAPDGATNTDTPKGDDPRSDILFYRQACRGNTILDKYLEAKGIRVRKVSTIVSSPDSVISPDCRLLFVELNFATPEYFELLRCLQFLLQSKETTVIAIIGPDKAEAVPELMRAGFTDVLVSPVSAGHICSIVDANSTINTSIQRIFSPE